MADWHWEPVTDDLLDGLPPAALAAVLQVAGELTVRESMIFLDGREFTGDPPGLRTVQRGQLTRVSEFPGEATECWRSCGRGGWCGGMAAVGLICR